jgi:hypothetical protein
MNPIEQKFNQISDATTISELKQRILTDQVLMQMLNNYTCMDDEELIKKYTLFTSSKKYKNLKVKMANAAWESAYAAC